MKLALLGASELEVVTLLPMFSDRGALNDIVSVALSGLHTGGITLGRNLGATSLVRITLYELITDEGELGRGMGERSLERSLVGTALVTLQRNSGEPGVKFTVVLDVMFLLCNEVIDTGPHDSLPLSLHLRRIFLEFRIGELVAVAGMHVVECSHKAGNKMEC